MGFGENLQVLRKRKNISQETLAEELQVSRQTIGKWENGITYPEAEFLILISDFFEVSIDALLKGSIAEAQYQKNSTIDERQRNHKIRFAAAMILFMISPFYPGETGANSIGGFFMFLSIAVGIGLLIYNHLTKTDRVKLTV